MANLSILPGDWKDKAVPYYGHLREELLSFGDGVWWVDHCPLNSWIAVVQEGQVRELKNPSFELLIHLGVPNISLVAHQPMSSS